MNLAEECRMIANGVNADREKEKEYAATSNYHKFIKTIKEEASKGRYQIKLSTTEDCGRYLGDLLERDGFNVESTYTIICGAFFQENYTVWWYK